jgi:peptide/nickel transport system permease protein
VIATILRRLLSLVAVLIGVTLITFCLSNVVPGDPAAMMAGPRASAQAVEQIRRELGLDQPMHRQYVTYVGHLLSGDLGVSIVTRRPVAQELLAQLPATVELMVVALALSAVAGIALGVVCALRRDSWLDHALRTAAILGVSLPRFVVGLLLVLLLYGAWSILPGGGRLDPMLAPPERVTGLLLVDTLVAGDRRAFLDALAHLILPALTLAITTAGGYMRLMRTSMLEVLAQDYVRTARAMGLRHRTIILRYALRNALLPIVTVIGLSIGALLFGSVVVEAIFSWPGMGSYVLSAIFALDFPVIMGFTVLVSVVYVITNLAVDLIYMLLDPRIREVG